ncbi:hypothetical protein [Sulfurihydrogenibium azorense]|uniref:Uncharacterized protein n=1 Tax=Sulfurihydrogenibium azorense (strain DSM 15241 / OCM 825 / Az-Fu1) TaxID=204536 RepID=C1DUV5_SULAA|nr:hypothetical protein [Sulfurihydrogenibium azorense]ACN99714.1 hypothetical protein SULAZ_0919 [Sulfurihydrogenibium azorense Az-Fu1]MDM7274177.1 hypothetical protein [Sulfurihydrogenibium azorense]
MEFIIQNILALGLIFFLLVGIALAWNIKVMRYSLIAALAVVISITLLVKYGGLTVEKIIAKSGYIALFLVWLSVLIIFAVGMYKMWNNISKGQE